MTHLISCGGGGVSGTIHGAAFTCYRWCQSWLEHHQPHHVHTVPARVSSPLHVFMRPDICHRERSKHAKKAAITHPKYRKTNSRKRHKKIFLCCPSKVHWVCRQQTLLATQPNYALDSIGGWTHTEQRRLFVTPPPTRLAITILLNRLNEVLVPRILFIETGGRVCFGKQDGLGMSMTLSEHLLVAGTIMGGGGEKRRNL